MENHKRKQECDTSLTPTVFKSRGIITEKIYRKSNKLEIRVSLPFSVSCSPLQTTMFTGGLTRYLAVHRVLPKRHLGSIYILKLSPNILNPLKARSGSTDEEHTERRFYVIRPPSSGREMAQLPSRGSTNTGELNAREVRWSWYRSRRIQKWEPRSFQHIRQQKLWMITDRDHLLKGLLHNDALISPVSIDPVGREGAWNTLQELRMNVVPDHSNSLAKRCAF